LERRPRGSWHTASTRTQPLHRGSPKARKALVKLQVQIQKRIASRGLLARNPWGYPGRRAARSRHRSPPTRWIAKICGGRARKGRQARHRHCQLVERTGRLLANAASKLEHRPHPPDPGALRASWVTRSWAMPTYGRCRKLCRSPSLAKPCMRWPGARPSRSAGERLVFSEPPCRRSSKSCWRSCAGADQSAKRCCAPLSSAQSKVFRRSSRSSNRSATAMAVSTRGNRLASSRE